MEADETKLTAVTRSTRLFAVSQAWLLVAGFALQVLVSRSLGAADYGRFVVVQMIGLALMTLVMSVIPNALRRAVSLHPSSLEYACRMVGCRQFPLSVLLGGALWLTSPALADAFHDERLLGGLRWMALDLAIKGGLLEPGWQLLNGAQRHGTQSALMAAHGLWRLVGVVSALAFQPTLDGAFLGLLASSAVSSLCVLVCLERSCRRVVVDAGHSPDIDLWRWMQFATVADVLNQLLASTNLWLLKGFSTDERSFGAYAACHMLVQPVLPCGLILSRSTFATFARTVTVDRASAARMLRRSTELAVVLMALGIALAQSRGSRLVAFVYGAGLSECGPLLGMMSVGMASLAVMWFFCEMLGAGNWLGARLAAVVGTTLVALPLAVVLIRAWGAAEAGIASMLVGIVGSGLAWRLLSRRVGDFFPWSVCGRATLSGLLVWSVGQFVLTNSPAIPLVFDLTILTGCFAVLMRLTTNLAGKLPRANAHVLTQK